MNEEQLIEMAKGGDRNAFAELTATLRGPVARFVGIMIGDEAEDVVQEAFTRAFSKLDAFAGRSRFSTWIYGIALNLCRRIRRDRKRHADNVEQDVLQAQPSPRGRKHGVLSTIIRHEQAAEMEMAVDRLPNAYKEAFVLRYVDELEYDDIAEIIETTTGTARARAHRARNLLKSELGGIVDTVWVQNK